VPLNFDLAGKRYEPVAVTVTPEQIAEYAAASGDENPQHLPGPDQVAPAVFPMVPGFSELMAVGADPELGVDNPLMIVHGEQEFVYHRPLRPEPLVMEATLASVEDKGKGATYVVAVAVSDSAGEPVVDEYSTIFVRGGGSGRERPRREAVPPPVRGSQAVAFTSTVAEDMPRRYAPASGDHNPIHLDADVATGVGLPGVINHGLGTLSLVAGGLVRRCAGGDVTRLRRLQVRFTDMVFPGSELATTVWERADAPGLVFETTRPDGAAVMSGLLEVSST
jgi:acyl dehydratase